MAELKKLVAVLRRGGLAVVPTDTLFGLVGRANRPATVARIYRLRQRPSNKPCIILISSLRQLKLFGVRPTAQQKARLEKYWPGPVSIIFPLSARSLAVVKKLAYLHRGRKTLAFRLPRSQWLKKLISRTGPLVAPSANPAGRPPAATITQAKRYFGHQVNYYLNGGRRRGRPSTLVRVDQNGKIKIIRP